MTNIKFAYIVYKDNFVNAKFDHKLTVPIDNIKYSEDADIHIQPKDEKDFSPRHKYTVVLCECDSEDGCANILDCKNKVLYQTLILGLAGE